MTYETKNRKEIWECRVFFGRERKGELVFNPEIKTCFVKPLLQFSEQKLHFKYFYEKDVLITPLQKSITLKNITALPLSFIMKCPAPFSVNRLEHHLFPEQETTIDIQFDPGMKTDRISTKSKCNLKIIYRDHKQRDKIMLLSETWFPNLHFTNDLIDFGTIMNGTIKTKHVTLNNTSLVPVEFTWFFFANYQ